ncbi:hypothetical protein NP493_594g00026 [Ridgeia piscesae]|uniref:Uncharacterized protein n=1 Tax=Ridgeia piscesae TaxID=27915 RepID=A0AAD9NR42_RIDPI|nr:hypothetical protein NP493_594g00026 [Ridgeia piscesae]
MHDLAPDYLNCAIPRDAPIRALRWASDATLLAVTVPRRTVGSSLACPTMWNSLPKVYKINRDIGNFPRKKT